MSDTLADLASCLPSDFPFMDTTTDFPSSSSTDSDSDDDDIPRFSRSASLQHRLRIPCSLQKRVFSGLPESTLSWTASGPSQVRSSPTTPFLQADKDAWGLIYAAAAQVARMKMRMNNGNFYDDFDANKNNRGLLGAPRPVVPPLPHRHNPRCTMWSESQQLLRQQQFGNRVAGGANYGGGGGRVGERPTCLPRCAWPSLVVDNQRGQQPCNGFVVKPVVGGSSGRCGHTTSVVKKERAGTGVFLPRRYCNDPSEPKKKPACPPAHPPGRVDHTFNKNMDPIIAQAQPNIHGGFVPHYEMVMGGRKGVTLGQQRRSSSHMGVTEAGMGHPEIVLPQEWTY